MNLKYLTFGYKVSVFFQNKKNILLILSLETTHIERKDRKLRDCLYHSDDNKPARLEQPRFPALIRSPGGQTKRIPVYFNYGKYKDAISLVNLILLLHILEF